jgi:hypothetical protein
VDYDLGCGIMQSNADIKNVRYLTLNTRISLSLCLYLLLIHLRLDQKVVSNSQFFLGFQRIFIFVVEGTCYVEIQEASHDRQVEAKEPYDICPTSW